VNSCVNRRTCTAPARRSAAEYTASAAAIAPEWVRAPVRVEASRPAFSTTTGFTVASARSALMKPRASLTASR